jgi:hypothetical protein
MEEGEAIAVRERRGVGNRKGRDRVCCAGRGCAGRLDQVGCYAWLRAYIGTFGWVMRPHCEVLEEISLDFYYVLQVCGWVVATCGASTVRIQWIKRLAMIVRLFSLTIVVSWSRMAIECLSFV